MPNNPYDELLRSLARLIEQVTGLEQNMRTLKNVQPDTPHIIGCAIITGGMMHEQEIPVSRPLEVGYEIIDGGDCAFLTVALPGFVPGRPEVEITPDTVYITAAGSRAPVSLGFETVPEACSYSVRNGIIDVVLIKKTGAPDNPEEQDE